MAELFREVLLVPPQRRKYVCPIDPERVDDEPHLRSVERHSEDTHLSIIASSHLYLMRSIGQNRAWTKNYGIILGLCKHPKTPPAIAMSFVQRLNEKDLKMISTDRNAKDGLRLLARKMLIKGKG